MTRLWYWTLEISYDVVNGTRVIKLPVSRLWKLEIKITRYRKGPNQNYCAGGPIIGQTDTDTTPYRVLLPEIFLKVERPSDL